MKRLLLTLGLLWGAAYSADAQFSLGGLLRSSNQQFIEEALSESVMLIRQEYQLEDTTTMQRYTWNNRPEFGSAENFAVRTTKGYITHRNVVEPWLQDDHYAPYRGTQLRPVLTRTALRTVKDSLWREVGCIAPTQRVMVDKSEWDHLSDTLFLSRGLCVEPLEGEQEGWLVWLTASDRSDLSTTKLALVTYRHALALSADKSRYELPDPTTQAEVVGGLYVVPRYDGCGTITFLLQGIAIKEGEHWALLIPREEVEGEEVEPMGELTPVSALAEPELAVEERGSAVVEPVEEAPTVVPATEEPAEESPAEVVPAEGVEPTPEADSEGEEPTDRGKKSKK
uniref:hypothetical protein n=1 Tax=Alistipes sp. TaxID=1872444 RepID=UPI0040579DA7